MGLVHSTISISSKRLAKIFTFFQSILYKTVNGLLQKVIFYLPGSSRKTSPDPPPLLPIQNQNPSLLLITCETKPSSSSTTLLASASTSAADLLDRNYVVDHELQCHDIIDVSAGIIKQMKRDDQIIISLPDQKNVPLLEEGKEEEKVMIKSSRIIINNVVGGEREREGEGEAMQMMRWIKHYNSRHRILLVGEGDFSFSASLALAFGASASNMISTSLDSKAFLKKNYWNAESNIVELRSRGCKVMHGIDATVMAYHEFLGTIKFDSIVFNFPFAGFFQNLSRDDVLRRHRRLVSLFLKNAKEMVSENGEIHITHKTNGFHLEWNVVSMASSHGLRLIEAVDFNIGDYPGYRTKRGFGGNKNFNCDPSMTYKFGLKY